jgi:Potassium-transporting ATPase A subunit
MDGRCNRLELRSHPICSRRSHAIFRSLRTESALYRVLGVHPDQEMSAATYAGCFLSFGTGCAVLLFLVLMLQHALPGGPSDSYLTTPMMSLVAAFLGCPRAGWRGSSLPGQGLAVVLPLFPPAPGTRLTNSLRSPLN